MNFAIVPTSSDRDHDKLFDISDQSLNADNRLMTYYEIRFQMKKDGHDLRTYDMYEDYSEVDYFIFYRKATKLWINLLLKGYEDKIIYYACEPETVVPEHSATGLRTLSDYYKAILTWNDEAVDDIARFKISSTYYFHPQRGTISFDNRRLLVSISSNKNTQSAKGLYQERKRIIEYFEGIAGNDFALFGRGWENPNYRNYMGSCKDKFAVFCNFRFVLCLENMKDVCGYISEKIFDCFMAGTVPVYQGAVNIADFVPQECFIDYSAFKTPEELYTFLKNMDRETWLQYMNAIEDYIGSERISPFTAAGYCKTIYHVVDKMKQRTFHLGLKGIFKIIWTEVKRKLNGLQ